MAILTALLTHLDAAGVARQLEYLKATAPSARVVVCHGGRREDFDRVEAGDKLFVDDPSLRGPNRDQSYVPLLGELWRECVREEREAELVYLIEYDQLILRGDYEQLLTALAERSDAGLFGKGAGLRNDTNWPHFIRYRRDAGVNGYIAGISRRADPEPRYGCLGTGMLLRREALEALADLEDAPQAYLEMLVPTLVYHLGFDVADVDAFGDLYAHVRWRPEYTADEAIAAKRAGAAFVHPFKDLEALERIRDA